MKYHIIENTCFVHIKISGNTRKNEAIQAKRAFSNYFKEKGIRVIVDLKELQQFELITLLEVLNGIQKEISFLGGCMKLCSLKPDILNYFRENRLDQFFQIYTDEERAKKSQWRNHGKE
jgi:anti-anti-sigma regulatory factor